MKSFVLVSLLRLVLCAGCYGSAVAQSQAPLPMPDDRFKADILVVVAHPDDDTAAATYLNKAVFDEHKRVAVIFGNRGNSGPNAVGMEQSKALADIREMEARRSLGARGVTNIWFLNGQDTATQDVLHSLETWGHGAALEEVVRLVRLTRPEVILTWLPAYVAGENHGDHQAAAVLATEAFDSAGDPTVFPEQVTAPRAHTGISNYGEGLHPWQPKKIYYFSDATHQEFLAGKGPTYLATEVSKEKNVPYGKLNRVGWDLYATQLDFNEDTIRYFAELPDRFVLGKSLVPSTNEADVWSGVTPAPIPYHPHASFTLPSETGVTLKLGGPWEFYQQFYQVHDLASLQNLVPPQTALGSDRQLWIPLMLHNNTAESQDVVVASKLPADWKQFTGPGTYHLEPGAGYPIQVFLAAPPAAPREQSPQTLEWTATVASRTTGHIALKAYLEFDGVAQ